MKISEDKSFDSAHMSLRIWKSERWAQRCDWLSRSIHLQLWAFDSSLSGFILNFLGIQSPVWLLPSRLNGLTPRVLHLLSVSTQWFITYFHFISSFKNTLWQELISCIHFTVSSFHNSLLDWISETRRAFNQGLTNNCRLASSFISLDIFS